MSANVGNPPATVGAESSSFALQASSARIGSYSAVAARAGADDLAVQNRAVGSTLTSTSAHWKANTNNIWGNGPMAFGTAPSSRDRSSTREKSSFAVSSEEIPGKTGSSSLLPSSHSDAWTAPSQWGPTGDAASRGATISTRKASGVSPARHQVPVNGTNHNLLENSISSNQFIPNPRPGVLGLDPVNRTGSLQSDSTTNGLLNAYNSFESIPNSQHHRPSDSSAFAWTDAASVHSPVEDRRSFSEHFGGSSSAASRSGSMPPSRHGNDPSQFPQHAAEAFPRYPQNPTGPGSRGHTSSLSSHSNRTLSERTYAFPTTFPTFPTDPAGAATRLTVDGMSQQTNGYHRASRSNISSYGSYTHNQNEQRFPLQMNGNGHSHGFEVGTLATTDIAALENFQPPGQELMLAFGNLNLGDRGSLTPNPRNYRGSPCYSTGNTPPVFDHLYPSRSESQSRSVSSSAAAALEKLTRLQQEQQYLTPQYNQIFGLPQYPQTRFNLYQQYQMPNGIPFAGVAPPMLMPVPSMPGMMPMDPPRAPKDLDLGLGLRSNLLHEFKSNGAKGGRRWELKDIYDHVVEFSGDQHGSRFIQQKLETANSDEKERIFREIQSNAIQLMLDIFGNYVIQKFFEHGDQSQKKVLAAKMKGQVLHLSLQMYGCRVVQKALEHILTDQQAQVVRELESSVLKCVKDQNGNHVIQKAIERVPAEHIQFIINAFTGQVPTLATHPYGCRVIQRMLEHCEGPARVNLLHELHGCGTQLLSDQYGNYVTQHIIEHGSTEDRSKIIGMVRGNVMNFSKHKFASNVVEKCLQFGSDEQRRDLMLRILDRPEAICSREREGNLTALIKDSYGNYVVQKLLDVLSPADYPTLVDALNPEMLKAKRAIAGKQVLAVENKMHRFDVQTQKLESSQSQPQPQSNSARTGTTMTPSPPTPNVDTSAAATPPPSLTVDALSVRSDSIPSTMSGVEEPISSLLAGGEKMPPLPLGVVVPQIGITDTSLD